MNTVSSTGARSQSRTPLPNTEVLEKPKRRRFSVAEKLRILREADRCATGTLGARLRREGIYSSAIASSYCFSGDPEETISADFERRRGVATAFRFGPRM